MKEELKTWRTGVGAKMPWDQGTAARTANVSTVGFAENKAVHRVLFPGDGVLHIQASKAVRAIEVYSLTGKLLTRRATAGFSGMMSFRLRDNGLDPEFVLVKFVM